MGISARAGTHCICGIIRCKNTPLLPIILRGQKSHRVAVSSIVRVIVQQYISVYIPENKSIREIYLHAHTYTKTHYCHTVGGVF